MSPTHVPVRVAVVNDYDIVVRGLAAMLEPYADRVLVVETDARMPVVSDVDIVLYDTFGQVQADQIDVTDLLADGTARLVVYTWNTDRDLVDRAMAKDASGYISKKVTTETLVHLLEEVHAGRTVRPAVEPDDAAQIPGDWPGRSFGLSAREAEVIALITQGKTNDEIARHAFLSPNTVKTYIRTGYRKIGVQRRTQAVLWGIANGFEPDRNRTF